MNKRKPDNRGISLVELMVALAILALLMTAVIMMMSNNSIVYKKNKADVSVQTNAQETFNTLQDSIMQAKEIKFYGYTGSTPSASVEYTKANIADLKDEASGELKEFHPTKVSIKYSALNKNESLDNYNCTVNYYFVRYNDGDTKKCSVFVTHTDYDTAAFTADTWVGKVDPSDADGWTPENEVTQPGNSTKNAREKYDRWLLSSSLTETTLTVDPESQAVGVSMHFMDRNRVYDTSGIVTIRNSYVLNSRRERNEGSSGNSEESSVNNGSDEYHNE